MKNPNLSTNSFSIFFKLRDSLRALNGWRAGSLSFFFTLKRREGRFDCMDNAGASFPRAAWEPPDVTINGYIVQLIKIDKLDFCRVCLQSVLTPKTGVSFFYGAYQEFEEGL